MAQFSAPGTFITQRGTTRVGRYTLMYVGMLVLIGAIAIAATVFFQLNPAPNVQAQPQADQLVDGWMTGVTAANRAARLEAANRIQDGWSSYLFVEVPEATDGWASYLLKEEPVIVDGWASRYLVDDD